MRDLRWFIEEVILDCWDLAKLAVGFVIKAIPFMVAAYVPLAAFTIAAALCLFLVGAL